MNEFDLQLESELQRLLDPIAAAPAPPRRGRRIPEAPKVELRLVTPETLAVVLVEVY